MYEKAGYFKNLCDPWEHSKTGQEVKTWFEAIELDDYVSYGGKA